MSRHGSFSDSASSRCARLRHAAALAITMLTFTACVSIETVVPPVTMLKAHGGNAATLEAGRRIYLGSCTHCHRPEPVREFAAARWPDIIADMSERSKLSAAQRHEVLAYVLAAAQAP